MKSNRWLERIAPRFEFGWQGEWRAGAVEPGRRLRDHELVLVRKGSCRIEIEGVPYELGPGSFLIVPPSRLHATLAGPDGVFRSCVHFDWLPAGPYPSRRKGPPRLWAYHPQRFRPGEVKAPPAFLPAGILRGRFDGEGPVVPLVETLLHRWKAGTGAESEAVHPALHELLLRLLWKKEGRSAPAGRGPKLAYRIKDLLDGDRARPIQELLPSLGFSYAHLSRVFRRQFGLSPIRYRNASRLERAKELLRDPRKTIAEAAYTAGFHDPAYFTRRFQATHGLPPSRWR